MRIAVTALSLGGCAALLDNQVERRAEAAERRFPPTGQLLEVNGLTVHADIRGQGPDLVLLHGASGSSRDFTFDLVGRLQDRYRVITFDRPHDHVEVARDARAVRPIFCARRPTSLACAILSFWATVMAARLRWHGPWAIPTAPPRWCWI